MPGAQRVGCAGNCWQAPAISADGGTTWTSASAALPLQDSQQPGRGRQSNACSAMSVASIRSLAQQLHAPSSEALSLGSDARLGARQATQVCAAAAAPTSPSAPSGRRRATRLPQKKFLLVNAEEGEPGIYKDRHLLEGDPHRVLEGILIAALGIGATDVVIFVNGEARLARERLFDRARRVRADSARSTCPSRCAWAAAATSWARRRR